MPKFPVVGWAPLKSMEQLGPLVVFAGMQAMYGLHLYCVAQGKTRQEFVALKFALLGGLAAAGALALATLLGTGKVWALSVRVSSLFVPHTRTGNPLVDSVAEHQATPPSVYWQYFFYCCYLAPVGCALAAWPDDARGKEEAAAAGAAAAAAALEDKELSVGDKRAEEKACAYAETVISREKKKRKKRKEVGKKKKNKKNKKRGDGGGDDDDDDDDDDNNNNNHNNNNDDNDDNNGDSGSERSARKLHRREEKALYALLSPAEAEADARQRAYDSTLQEYRAPGGKVGLEGCVCAVASVCLVSIAMCPVLSDQSHRISSHLVISHSPSDSISPHPIL